VKRALPFVLLGGLVLFVLIQLVPVARDNPPVEEEVPASAEVRAVLRRACYDCHSNETRWPWYARIAPASWLLAHDVAEARDHMNFSTWNVYDDDERRDHLDETWEEVEAGEMPLWFYLPMHPDARLSEADLTLLREWTETTGP
jgi:hypothetical protein